MYDYEVLKNRLTNARPYTKTAALDRINALANALEISQQQADDLTALALANGREALPGDFDARLTAVEQTTMELENALRQKG